MQLLALKFSCLDEFAICAYLSILSGYSRQVYHVIIEMEISLSVVQRVNKFIQKLQNGLKQNLEYYY